MESDPGKEKWNYPIYSYAYSSGKRSRNLVEVKMNLAYAKDSSGEYQESPRIRYIKYFHYALTINDRGDIVGGYFYNDSSVIDLLWVPLRPKPSRAKGNEMGNPYVNVDQVLAIWRASVPQETRKKWPVIDPAPADRGLDLASIKSLIPLQDPHAPAEEATVAATPDAAGTDDIQTPEAAATASDATEGETPDSTDTAAAPADDTPEATETTAASAEDTLIEATETAAASEEEPVSRAAETAEAPEEETTADPQEMAEIAAPGEEEAAEEHDEAVAHGRRRGIFGRRR
jgi:hypothetical protein